MTKLIAWRCFSVVMALALILGVASIAIPAGTVGADEESWDIQTVDDTNVFSTSLALDSNGYPHISYTTLETDHSLHYAQWTGTEWEKEMVDDVPAVVTSLALDSQDRPHIAYTTFAIGDNSLHYARWTGTAWAKETVDESDVSDCSLALDSQDRPHISYIIPSDVDPLRYAWLTGTGWEFDTIDPLFAIPTSCSLALDSHDGPHIGYATIDLTSVHYFHLVGGEWVDEVVDEGPAGAISIALDSQGNPHISYATAQLFSLHYASRTGAGWTTETVDPVNASDCSLALDSQDRPHISYHVGGGVSVAIGTADVITDGITISGMLKYAYWTGSAWDIQTVDQETIHLTAGLDSAPFLTIGGSKWSSIALDSSDLPHISYGNLVSSMTVVAPTSLHYAYIPPVMMPPLSTSPTGPRVSPSPPPQPLNPPQMTIQFLNVSPQQASANQPVTITTNVVNTGDEAGNYYVALKINGQMEQSRMVGVSPHGTQPVKFTVTKDKPGTYSVDIADQRGSFTILGDSSTGGAGQKTGAMIVLVLIGILITASVAVLLLRRT